MKTHVCLTGVVAALLGLGVARGQGPANPPVATGGVPAPVVANNNGPLNNGAANNGRNADANEYTEGGIRPDGGQRQGSASGPPVYGPGLSEWLEYPRPCNCCGPVGKCGPIGSEVYGRTGVSFLTGGGLVGDHGRPGFMAGAGLRTLYFSQPDAAWVIDLGLSTQWHDIMHSPPTVLRNVDVFQTAQGSTQQTKTNVPSVTVIASSVHYLLGNLTLGRELYLWGGPDCSCETRCRVGWDAGGLYGSSKMNAVPQNLQAGQALRHRTDTVGGVTFALHGDVEIPTGCCIRFVGGRVEYGAIWTDILQHQNDANTQMVNFLLNVGLRF
jgi:hypothetical protein